MFWVEIYLNGNFDIAFVVSFASLLRLRMYLSPVSGGRSCFRFRQQSAGLCGEAGFCGGKSEYHLSLVRLFFLDVL